MYKGFLRPILFLFKPETVHQLVVYAIKSLFLLPFIKSIFSSAYTVHDQRLRRDVFGLSFENPVGLGAGFDKNATFFNQFAAFGFAFIEVGTVTPVGQPGNQKPRSFRLVKDKALVNRMGFNNQGAERAAQRLRKRKTNIILGGNIGKNTATDNKNAIADYASCFESLYDVVDYLVINVSCPNISDLGQLQDRDQLEGILKELASLRTRRQLRKPLLVKISPDLNYKQIDDVLDLIGEFGLDGIVAVNTTITRENLVTDPKKIERVGKGGLSGEPIRDRSNEIIRYIRQQTEGKLPIIGVGGIMSEADALEKLEAGASLVQIYTGFIYEGPGLARRINRALL